MHTKSPDGVGAKVLGGLLESDGGGKIHVVRLTLTVAHNDMFLPRLFSFKLSLSEHYLSSSLIE